MNVSINTGKNIMRPYMSEVMMLWKWTLRIHRTICVGALTPKPLLGVPQRGNNRVGFFVGVGMGWGATNLVFNGNGVGWSQMVCNKLGLRSSGHYLLDKAVSTGCE